MRGRQFGRRLHELINQTDIAILSAYNAEIRGLYNYYSLANDAYKIGRFANIMKYSMYKTFANKYRTYGQKESYSRRKRPAGENPRTVADGKHRRKRQF